MSTEATDTGVTFENGRAVEQTTEGHAPEEGSAHGDERAAAIAAVKAALLDEAKAEGKKAAKEAKEALDKDPLVPKQRGANGKFLSDMDPAERDRANATEKLERQNAPRDAAQTDEDKEASQLKKLLTERKETAKYKAEANAQLERERAEVRRVYQETQREKAEIAAERARFAMYRKDPMKAVREFGGQDPEAFILELAQEGTPEGAARRAQRERDAELQEIRQWRADQERQVQERQEHEHAMQRRQYRQNIEREMVVTAFAKRQSGEEAHPHIAEMYHGHEVSLIREADTVAEQYRNVTGQEATFAQIAEYLEERAALWYKSLVSKRGGQAPTPVTQGRPTPGRATGKTSLSPAGSSERRTLGDRFADLDGEERRETAMAAVRAAIAASGGLER